MIIQRPQLLQKLLLKRHNGMVKVVTGIRRAGKSYLLNRLQDGILILNIYDFLMGEEI